MVAKAPPLHDNKLLVANFTNDTSENDNDAQWQQTAEALRKIDPALADGILKDGVITTDEIEKAINSVPRQEVQKLQGLYRALLEPELGSESFHRKKTENEKKIPQLFSRHFASLDFNNPQDRKFAVETAAKFPVILDWLPPQFLQDPNLLMAAMRTDTKMLRLTVWGDSLAYFARVNGKAYSDDTDVAALEQLASKQFSLLVKVLSEHPQAAAYIDDSIFWQCPKFLPEILQRCPLAYCHLPSYVRDRVDHTLIKSIIFKQQDPKLAAELYAAMPQQVKTETDFHDIMYQIKGPPQLLSVILAQTSDVFVSNYFYVGDLAVDGAAKERRKDFNRLAGKLAPEEKLRLYPYAPSFWRQSFSAKQLLRMMEQPNMPGEVIVGCVQSMPEHERQKISRQQFEGLLRRIRPESLLTFINTLPKEFFEAHHFSATDYLSWYRRAYCNDYKTVTDFYELIPDSIKASPSFFLSFLAMTNVFVMGARRDELGILELWSKAPPSVREDPEVLYTLLCSDHDALHYLLDQHGSDLSWLSRIASHKKQPIQSILLSAAQAENVVTPELVTKLGINANSSFWTDIVHAGPFNIFSVPAAFITDELVRFAFVRHRHSQNELTDFYKNLPNQLKTVAFLAELVVICPAFVKACPEDKRQQIWQTAITQLKQDHLSFPPEINTESFSSFEKSLLPISPNDVDVRPYEHSLTTIAVVLANRAIRPEDDQRKSVLVLKSTVDDNQHFTVETEHRFSSPEGRKTHRLAVRRVRSDDDIVAFINSAKHPLHYLQISGHGERPWIQLGRGPGGMRRYLDVNDTKVFAAIANSIAHPNGVIVLDSCSTGEGRAYKENLANALANYLRQHNIHGVRINAWDRVGYNINLEDDRTDPTHNKYDIKFTHPSRRYEIIT